MFYCKINTKIAKNTINQLPTNSTQTVHSPKVSVLKNILVLEKLHVVMPDPLREEEIEVKRASVKNRKGKKIQKKK